MARATRSSTQHQEKEKEKLNDAASLTSRSKIITKKRKRAPASHDDGQPASKQLRTDWDVKDETGSEPDTALTKENNLPHMNFSGDMPIDPSVSQKILDVLEMIDNQDLLEQVFALAGDSSTSQPKMYSLKTLLKEPHHPLSAIRSAVHHLLPIPSRHHARPSTPTAQQLRFCDLALSLLNQASFRSAAIPLDLDSLFPTPPESHADADLNESSKRPRVATTESSPASPVRKHRYALLQRLSSGDWWTSLNSDLPLPSFENKDVKDLYTAHAELVPVFPTPSRLYTRDTPSDTETKVEATPTLGSYGSRKASTSKTKMPGPRRVSCGAFLDYGPYSSFAPSFDQDGVEVGRNIMGEVIWGKEERRRKQKITIDVAPSEVQDVTMADDVQGPSENERGQREKIKEEVESALNGLFPPDQATMIKSALSSLELENAVHELLERNQKALLRLEELQRLRLSGKGGASSGAVDESEEWYTAQEIMNTLVVLTSLSPRSSSSDSDVSSLIPPTPVLRKLQRTLPLEPSRGWYGTLPPTRSTALRDDSTVRMRSGVPAVPSTTLNTVTTTPLPAATSASTTSTTAPGSVYPGYSYSAYATPYRGGYTPYKAGQTPAYYSAAYAAHTPQSTTQSQTATQTYYPNPPYSTPGQQQYSYGSWYNYQTPAATGTGSGRGTPQPGATAGTAGTAASSSTMNYAGFFSGAQQSTTGQRAVANTALSVKQYNPGTAAAGTTTTFVPPTLPAYARSSAVGTQASTPGFQQPNFYPQPTPTPSAVQ